MAPTRTGNDLASEEARDRTGATASPGHLPVLYQSILESLAIKPGGDYLDGTVGAGGHASGILAASSPNGRLLGLDRDPEALSFSAKRLSVYGDRVTLVHGSFRRMKDYAKGENFGQFDGVLLDLGLSSRQLDDPIRGFAFRFEGPLDMRLDPGQSLTAADLVNGSTANELADIIYRYGEERNSRRIARAIVQARPVQTTAQLAALIGGVVRQRERGLHPATRTFQALRIAVNNELSALEEALPQAVAMLNRGGRLAVIAFHSLEDRIVKGYFRREARDCVCPPELPVCRCGHQATIRTLTPKPIRPGPDEVARNRRSRSARLRVAERI